MLPEGANSFLLEKTLFQKGAKIILNALPHIESASFPLQSALSAIELTCFWQLVIDLHSLIRVFAIRFVNSEDEGSVASPWGQIDLHTNLSLYQVYLSIVHFFTLRHICNSLL